MAPVASPEVQMPGQDYGLYFDTAVRAARKRGMDVDAAQDVAQDLMVRLVANGGVGQVEGANFNPVGYVLKATKNMVIDAVRRENRRPDCIDDSSDELPKITGRNGEDEWVDRHELETAIAGVRPEYREPLIMHAWGLEYSEIASILHVPMGTVRSRIARGRQEARELLDNRGDL